MYVDTHAHYNLPAFDEDRGETLARVRASGVEKVICPAISYDSNVHMMECLAGYDDVFFAAGIHPKSYYWNAVSEKYDDLVRRPGRVVVPLICVEFEEIEGDEGERRNFPFAIPSDTTTSEIRELLGSLTAAADPCALVVEALCSRYGRAREIACATDSDVGTQLFHNPAYRKMVLVEGKAWVCSLRMAYSHALATVIVDSGEDLPVSCVIDELLEGQKLLTTYFEIPLDAFER